MAVELLTTTHERTVAKASVEAVADRPSLWSRRPALIDETRGYARRLTWWERLIRRAG